MKKLILLLTLTSATSYAAGDIDVTVDWIGNVARSTVLEVCGKAISKSGKWPLVITITHGESTYSTLTGRDGNYCQLLARQTYKGKVQATAASMDGQSFGFANLPEKKN